MTAISSAAPSPALAAHSDAVAGLVEMLGASVWAVLGRRHVTASAATWRDDLVVTTAHSFRRVPAAITLVGADGKTAMASLVGLDTPTDIALFRLADAPPAAALALGAAATVKAGHFAVAVGRSGEGDLLASAGIVNRAGGPWQTWLGGQVDHLIRLDGGLHDGLSGAPVADASGAVIGIATAALSRSQGVVVPTSTVLRVVEALATGKRVARPWLGIGAQPVPLPTDAARLGLLVTALASGSPAARAGMLVGDIVVSAAAVAVDSLAALRSALAEKVGAEVPLALLRGGVPLELRCSVGEWPAERRCC